ncbi:cationic amino acid transporter 4-like [Copidosoma floridanum]|uniref:cationic amino acid transporter 4-like n=1 Tax=Copidosoma floridanum TaxID=29053 RepID=UPI000C6FB078|nr:cationic amino acid transporter 4-like [Copidosoma floridanum]
MTNYSFISKYLNPCAASVARAWSGYVDSLSGRAISNFTKSLVSGYESLGTVPDPLAGALCLVYALLLTVGVKCSAAVNSLLTIVNLGVMGLVIGLGFYHGDIANWNYNGNGFLPYGLTGVFAGAATCFYAFVGFDSIATSGEEARDPGRSIPRATGLSMAIVTIGYVLVGAALTLVEPYSRISRTAALPEAFDARGLPWARYVISVGALCGMTTTLFGSLFSLPRTMYAMASDGLLFGFLARVSKRTQVPTVNLAISGVFSGLIALLFDLDHLVEFMSIGTFLAYTIVSVSVIVLRYRPAPPPSQAMDNTLSTDTTTSMAGTTGPGTGGSSSHQLASPANTDLMAMDSSESLCTPVESQLTRQLIQGFCTDNIGRVRPRYTWLANLLADCEPGTAVTMSIVFYSVACASFCSFLVLLSQSTYSPPWWEYIMVMFLVFILVAKQFCMISTHKQLETGKLVNITYAMEM